MPHSALMPTDLPSDVALGEFSISKKRKKNPFSGFFADAPILNPVGSGAAIFLNPDKVVLAEGGASGLGIYDQVVADDGHLRGVWRTRVHAVIGLGFEVIAAGEEHEHLEDAEFARNALEAIYKFDAARADLMKYRMKGYSVGELVWASDGTNLYVEKVKSHDPRMFCFGAPAGELRLIISEDGRDSIALDPNKWLTQVHDGSSTNPYGVGIGQTVYYPALYKKHALQNWHVMGEKHSMPTIENTYKSGMGINTDDMLDLAEAATTQQAVAHDDTIELTPINTAGATNPDIHDKQISRLNDEMSVAVIGQILSSTPSNTGLGNGQASLQGQVKRDVLADDAKDQESFLNEIIRLVILFNRGARAAGSYPTARVKVRDEEGQLDDAETLDVLVRAGVPVPMKWALEKFGIPAVQGDEPVLEPPGVSALAGIGGGGPAAPADNPTDDEEEDGSSRAPGQFAERTSTAPPLERHDDADQRGNANLVQRMKDAIAVALDSMARALARDVSGKRPGTRSKA